MPGETKHPRSVEFLVAGMEQATLRQRAMESDALAAELIGRTLACFRSGVPGSVCYAGQAKAILWLLARGTDTDEEFRTTVAAFQTLLSAHAARGRDACSRAELDPPA